MHTYERDPRDIGYIALYIAATWYEELNPDKARRIALGRQRSKPGIRFITSEVEEKIRAIVSSPNFHNVNALVKRFRINKYDIYRIIGGENAGEEAIVVSKVQALLLRLKNIASECTAVDCANCPLNQNIYGDVSLCDFLQNMQFDKDGRLVSIENMDVHKKCTKSAHHFRGRVKSKGFRVYESALKKMEEYI